jgi:hypothetical protein
MMPVRCRSLWLAPLFALLFACESTSPDMQAQLHEQQPEAIQPVAPPTFDQAGWTVFTPAAETRIVYVSSTSGNDGSGKVYKSSDSVIGKDPRNPKGAVKAFKTFAAAYKHTREGAPDWILLKRGDTFYGSVAVRSGKSQTEPFLLASYGTDGALPLVKAGDERALEICCKSFNDIAIQGIDFFAHTRDFGSPEFSSSAGGSGIYTYVEHGHRGKGLLIEGCKFRFFTGNYIQTDGSLTNVVFRRNLVLDSYSTESHSQGLYARNASLVVEGNIFDHNGWYRQQASDKLDNRKHGQATMFNHNTYFQDTKNVVFRNNIFLRPASIGTKWTANNGKASTRNIEISDNLYVDGEIGISMGGNKRGPLRFKNIRIQDNVLLNIGHSKPTNRDFAWYLDLLDWDQGEVSGNMFIHPGSKTTNNIFAIRLTGLSRDVDISDNTIYGFGNGQAITIAEKVNLQNVRVFDNFFHLQKNGRNFVRAKQSVEGIRFFSNHYASEAGADNLFSVRGAKLTLNEWQAQYGEKNAHFSKSKPLKPSGMIEDYQRAQGEPASFESFIQRVRDQSYESWNPAYTASAINRWIRDNYAQSRQLPSIASGARD